MAEETSSLSFLDRLIGWLRAVRHAASSRRLIEAQEAELRDVRHALGKLEQSMGISTAETAARLELVRHEFAHLTPLVDEALALRAPFEALDSSLKHLTAIQEQLATSQAPLSVLPGQLSALQGKLTSSHDELQAVQTKLAAEVSRLAPRFPPLAGAGDIDSATWLDAAFEETFRGTREQVRQRLAVYLPEVRDVFAATGRLGVVDVGCGRGEWLELMRTEGIAARGIDQNAFIVNQCRELGLDAQQADAMKALTDQPTRSLAAVTAFHLVEHLRLADQLQLMVAAFGALAPGGLFILETPNPENLIVGAWTFYMDPSHQRPLPPTLLRFLLEAVGFEVIDVRRLHSDDELAERATREGWPAGVQELLCGPRDFGVIARRPAR
jgi:SAM-dependent methyltransferase